MTEDERVIVYDEKRASVSEVADPAEELRELLQQDAYVDAMTALGELPVVDL